MSVRPNRVAWAVAGPVLALLWAGCPQVPQSPQEPPASDVPDAPVAKDEASSRAPRVDAITPNRGPAGGGTMVTIRGGPFENEIGVLFGAYAAVDPIIVNSSMITAITPPQAPAVVDVTVLADSGQTTVVGAFTYQGVDIVAISPDNGSIAGGTAVTITGENFSPNTLVKFGGEIASSISVVNSRLVTAVTPPHAEGWVRVTVLSDGTEDSLDPVLDPQDPTDRLEGFRYVVPVVQVSSVEPASGPITGGTMVTIRGTMLPRDAGVTFGGTSATQVTYINDQLITAIVPPGQEGAVDVTLVYPGGQVVVPNGFTYVVDGPVFDDGTDTDGDGLSDVQERRGWEVWIDSFGQALGNDTYFNTYHYPVTSDPDNTDTDGDGLTDDVEQLIKSDPRKYDSDDDGLHDAEEWNQWLTSPTSVDTDGDARADNDAQLAPNQALFDGLEMFDQTILRLPQGHPDRVVKPRGTSPTLSDTDGDGVSDFDEFDSTVRIGVLADLPQLEYRLVGDVDVRLDVEYAETIGETHEYGKTLTESRTDTVASSNSTTLGFSLEVMAGFEVGCCKGTPPVPSGKAVGSITAGLSIENTWTTSNETSEEISKEYSQVQTDSRELTEAAASGRITTAVILTNPGNTTFTLTGLGVVVQQREMRKEDGDTSTPRGPKTIATMLPDFDSITLAPGEFAGPIAMSAQGVNAQSIKELLAAPDTLMLGTAAMNFVDSNGLDFDYVRQFTVAQTAYIVIDFGDGEVRTYNVATNVDRNPDSSYRGIALGDALEHILGIPKFASDTEPGAETGFTVMDSPDGSDITVLRSLLGRNYFADQSIVRDYWFVITNVAEHASVDFDQMTLHAGDFVRLIYTRDDDGDGLSNTIERAAGTDEAAGPDADSDLLSDRLEVLDGWIVFEDPSNPDAPHPDEFAKRRVFSSGTNADTDGDGLTDFQEYYHLNFANQDTVYRSDPLDPDTDGDGLLDGVDPLPARRAGVRFVRSDGTDPAPGTVGWGRTWSQAYRTIQRALLDAAGNPHADPADDVSQIWVARGTYKPSAQFSPITLVSGVGIYGGFSGPVASTEYPGETKRGQRNTNAFSNGCVISGDLSSNDTGTISLEDPGTYADNCPVLVLATLGVTSSALLDGFMLTGAYSRPGNNSGALHLQGSPTIQNCLVILNGSQTGGAGVLVGNTSSPVFKKCIFASNTAKYGGGALILSLLPVVFEDCEFSQNIATRPGTNDADYSSKGGGVAIFSVAGRADFNRCVFTNNSAWIQGGAIYATGISNYVRVDSCRFTGNSVTTTGWLGEWRGNGGAIALDANGSVSNSLFWDNRSRTIGGAISVISGGGVPGDGWWNGPVRRCTITNCTIANNRSWTRGGSDCCGGVGTGGNKSNVLVQNSVVWGNWYGDTELPDDHDTINEYTQIHAYDWQPNFTVRNSFLNGAGPTVYRGTNGNLWGDAALNDLLLGDLRLGMQSPCVDRGSTFVDLDPLLPGLQALPELDLFGNPRIADGNGDGFTAVDMGAHEAQLGQP